MALSLPKNILNFEKNYQLSWWKSISLGKKKVIAEIVYAGEALGQVLFLKILREQPDISRIIKIKVLIAVLY